MSEAGRLQALLGCGSNCGTCLPEIDKLLIKHVFLASAECGARTQNLR